MAAKKKAEPVRFAGSVSVRATAEMLQELDRMAADLARQMGIPVNRSDVARKLITEAISRKRAT